MHQIETHLHTEYASSCGKLDAQTIIQAYAQAGYQGIVVTDHFCRDNWNKQGWGLTPDSFCIDTFLEGFYRLREAAEPYGITVYKGAEVRFDGSPNDYLLYHFPNELLRDPEAVFTMDVGSFHALCQKEGALLIQAHPYRGKCLPADPSHLDGIEILNMHPRHDSRNDLAQAFADANPHLLQLCGSDCHQQPDIGRGGILTDTLPRDEAELVQLLRSRSFQLIV